MSVFVLYLAVVLAAGGAYAANQNLTIDIGMRSYDGTMWFCNDGKDRLIPAKYATAASRKGQSFADLPAGEQPQMRKLKDGTSEPDVDDCGNAWVAFVSKEGQRRAYLVSTDGLHSVCTKTERVEQVEDINGKNYIVEMPFKTTSMSFEQLEEIAKRVAGNKKINDGKNDSPPYLYKATDFVVDLVLATVGEKAQAYLKASANNWPISIQLLDYDYSKKHGQSAFTKRGIPLGVTPNRTWLSRMQTINEDERHAPRKTQ